MWGMWLPHNRHFLTEVVSLAEAAAPSLYADRTDERIKYGHQMIPCRWCRQLYEAGTGPDWPAGYCTQVCVDRSGVRRAARDAVDQHG